MGMQWNYTTIVLAMMVNDAAPCTPYKLYKPYKQQYFLPQNFFSIQFLQIHFNFCQSIFEAFTMLLKIQGLNLAAKI